MLRVQGDTIIGAEFEPFRPLRSMLHGSSEQETVYSEEMGNSRLFKIRTADSHGERSSASVLIKRMYATRGYRASSLSAEQQPTRITLTASEHEQVIGTITIGFDSPEGLAVDQLFSEHTHRLRGEGRKVCEFTKLAMDSVVKSKRVLASLFHVAYIYAHRMMGFDDLLIEVNPRHVRYYHQMLGFEAIGEPLHNPRVDAPAVLMRLDFMHAHREIERLAGQPDKAANERALYPFFFAIHEEAGIVARLISSNPQAGFAHGLSAAERLAAERRAMH